MSLSDKLLITPTLLRRFELEGQFEGGGGQYYALMQRANGELVCDHPFGPALEPMQMLWSADVLRALNRELHHDGSWVVCFTHPQPNSMECVLLNPRHKEYGRYALLWLDKDGDVQFTVEWNRGEGELRDFAMVMLAGMNSTMAKCETAWGLWHEMMVDVIEPQEGQTFKRAQGQRRPSSH